MPGTRCSRESSNYAHGRWFRVVDAHRLNVVCGLLGHPHLGDLQTDRAPKSSRARRGVGNRDTAPALRMGEIGKEEFDRIRHDLENSLGHR